MKVAFRSVMIAVVALSMTAPAEAGGESPFRMSGTIALSPTPDPACGGLRNTSEGSLSGIPLGRVRWSVTEECVDSTVEPGIFVAKARFKLQNRGGTVAGNFTVRGGPPGARGVAYAWGPFKITTSTGRYKGTKGRGIYGVEANLVTNTARVELWGTLTSFPR